MEQLPREEREDIEEVEIMAQDARVGSRIMSVLMDFSGLLTLVAFTGYILYLCFGEYTTLFSWHPACMTVGLVLLMPEAVKIMSPNNIFGMKLNRQGRVRVHWVLQALGALCIFTGLLIIELNKMYNNKPHFHTWHSIIGLIFLILFGIASTGGVTTLYSLKVKNIIKPAKIKLLHCLIGIVTFLIGIFAEILGLYSHWFIKHSSETLQIVCTVIIIIAAGLSVRGALKSAYFRIMNLYQSI